MTNKPLDDREESSVMLSEALERLMFEDLRNMLETSPSMQGVPAAWVTAGTVDGQEVNGKPRRVWWENNEGVGMPIYAAPQPAPDVAGLAERVKELERFIELAFDAHPNLDLDVAAVATHRNQGGEE